MTPPPAEVVVVGAGPYGLGVAAHLRTAGIGVTIVGRPMSFWQEHMPRDMLLRSAWVACSIGRRGGDASLEAYRLAQNPDLGSPVPLSAFLSYAGWYREQMVGEVDQRLVRWIDAGASGFALGLEDGSELRGKRVVVAGGIAPFAHRPAELNGLRPELVSHTADHVGFDGFAGKRVTVVGGGQSAIESAALLAESGATVDVVVRAPHVHWLHRDRLGPVLRQLRPLLYTPEDVGPPGLNRVVKAPGLIRRLPRGLRLSAAQRSIRPAAASWLMDRLAGVPIRVGRTIESVAAANGHVELTFDGGEKRAADHLLLGTGYRVDVAGYSFLPRELLGRIDRVNGYPVLQRGFESSVPGLHFVGAPAAWSFGPLMRFVSGTWYSTRELGRRIAGR